MDFIVSSLVLVSLFSSFFLFLVEGVRENRNSSCFRLSDHAIASTPMMSSRLGNPARLGSQGWVAFAVHATQWQKMVGYLHVGNRKVEPSASYTMCI